MSNHYLTTHNAWDANLTVPLIVAKFHDEAVFADPVWGVKIRQVTADGKLVPAETYDVDLEDVNFSKIRIGALPFVYRVRFESFFFAKNFTPDNWQLERYKLPRGAKTIRIEYQARESNESLGPPMVLESRLSG